MSKIDPAILILKGKWEKAEHDNRQLRAEVAELSEALHSILAYDHPLNTMAPETILSQIYELAEEALGGR